MQDSNPPPISFVIIGIAGLLYTWSAVFLPQLRGVWKGSSVPISRRSSLVFAAAMSFWCAAVLGLGTIWCAAGFALCIATAVYFQRKDQDEHFKARGSSLAKEEKLCRKASFWGNRKYVSLLCVGLTTLQLIGFVHSFLKPQLTEEEHLILYANGFLFVMFLLCAIGIYFGKDKAG